jgi:hypothetical protein
VATCPTVGFADQTRAVDTARSHLCRHEEVRRACISGSFTPIVNSWLADRVGDDTAIQVNIADCTNFDGVAPAANSLAGKYCCSEWPKY